MKRVRKTVSFFLGMVKSNQEKSTIGILEKGSIKIEGTKDIMSEIENFYSTLYTTKPIDTCESWIDEIKQNTHIPQISDENLRKLTDELTTDSLAKIIKSCPKNKSPGNDGLPTEFYIVFWTKISQLLLETYKECIAAGEMSTSQKQSIIRLIPKKDRDKL